ncbi:hypothetical protein AX16_003809 [Volvariella volvacea WC 439]|nr:hypothetical protein AX16_003809 [Volvariella volvacea WC 439]
MSLLAAPPRLFSALRRHVMSSMRLTLLSHRFRCNLLETTHGLLSSYPLIPPRLFGITTITTQRPHSGALSLCAPTLTLTFPSDSSQHHPHSYMNSNTYPQSYPATSPTNPTASNQAINPAFLGNFQNQSASSNPKFPQMYGASANGGAINPSQLMNGMGSGLGNMGMNFNNTTISPAQLLQQQQSSNSMMNGANMGLMNMGMMNASGMPSAALAGAAGNGMHQTVSLSNSMSSPVIGMNPSSQQSHHNMAAGNPGLMGMHGNMGMNGMGMGNMGGMNAMAGGMGMGGIGPMGQNPVGNIGMSQPSNPPMGAQNILPMLSAAGYTREQFMAMSNQEKQIIMQKITSMQHHSREHISHPAQQSLHLPPQDIMQAMMSRAGVSASAVNFDRPSSSASTHSNTPAQQPSQSSPVSAGSNPMNPPPTPIQPSQSQQGSMMPPPLTPARPSTAQSHSRPGTSMSHHSPGASGVPRPPSRATPAPGGEFNAANGFPGKPNSQQSQTQSGQNPYPQGQAAGQGSPPPESPYRGSKRKLGATDVVASPRIGGNMGPPQSIPRSNSDLMNNIQGMGGANMTNMGMTPASLAMNNMNNLGMGMNMGGMNPGGGIGIGLGMPGQINGFMGNQTQQPSQSQPNPQMLQAQNQNSMQAVLRAQAQANQQRQSPRPQSANGMMNPSAMNIPGGMGQGGRAGTPGPSRGPSMDLSMGMSMGGMGMGGMGGGIGMGGTGDMSIHLPQQHGPQGGQFHPPSQIQPSHSQGTPQTPARQSSLPPQQQHPQQGMAGQGMPQGMSPQHFAQPPNSQQPQGANPLLQSLHGPQHHHHQQNQPPQLRQSSLPPTPSTPIGMGGMSMPSQGLQQPQMPQNLPMGMGGQKGMMDGHNLSGAHIKSEMRPGIVPPASGGAPMISSPVIPGTGPATPSVGDGVPVNAGTGAAGAAGAGSAAGPGTPMSITPSNSTGGVAQGGAPAATNAAASSPASAANGVGSGVPGVPLGEAEKLIPLGDEEMEQVQGWLKLDKEYDGLLTKMKERMTEEMREVFAPGGPHAAWWEKGSRAVNLNKWRARAPREGFDVRYPRPARRDNGQRRKNGRREGLRLPRKLDPEEANKPEQLVPIRLEFDVEHHKMRDTFIWNLNDPVVTPEIFAQTIVEDYNLAPNYHAVITKSIQDQLSDFKAHHVSYDNDTTTTAMTTTGVGHTGGDNDGDDESSNKQDGEITSASPLHRGQLDESNAAWWESWRKKLRTEKGYVRIGKRQISKGRKKRRTPGAATGGAKSDSESKKGGANAALDSESEVDRGMSLEEFVIDESLMHEEMRILIKLDVIVGSMKLDDQFEWDIDNSHASPEGFAEVYCQELGLGGEFQTAIAHSIREQVHTYQKSLFLVGHPLDGSAIQDDDLRSSFLPNLVSGARPLDQVQSYTPTLNYMSDGEIERTEKDREKDITKRRKRNMRGRRGVALPDREPIRTYRTPAIGFPELDPAALALAAAASAPVSSRRAAAAAATLTIANMVASENREQFSPQMMTATLPQPAPIPVPQVIAPPKEKKEKPKGLFKAPSYPDSVLRPRARVVAPTPSTAADVSKLPAPLENDPPPPTAVPTVIPPDSSKMQPKVNPAKRARELEREAKEKEFVDGQHPNYIDGVWHCSNCGCPESIAVGRRKGPLGDKSQCGTCGKFWHRHRRPRPVEYNSDPEYHSGLARKEAELAAKANVKKKGSALRNSTVAATPDVSEPQTPSRSNAGDAATEARQSPPPPLAPEDDDRPMSPVSTTSSASESPLAQRVKVNGHSNSASTASVGKNHAEESKSTSGGSASAGPTSQPTSRDGATSTPARAPTSSAGVGPSPSRPPAPGWLREAVQSTKAKYPHDIFELVLRKVNGQSASEWRIKCQDCPGKLYTPGPGETLLNYEVHLKNRQHRQRVSERLAKITGNASEGN